MKSLLLLLPLSLVALLSSGCGMLSARQQHDAPSSSRTYAQSLGMAQSLSANDPSLRIVQVSDTGSMKPVLGESSIVILEPARARVLRTGALISFVQDGVERIHRVESLTSDGVITQGDANSSRERVLFSQITGCSVAVLYFDPKTLPANLSDAKLPVAYAAAKNSIPTSMGLQLIGAQMLTDGDSAKVLLLDTGKYSVALPRFQNVRLFVGAAGSTKDNSSSVDINWNGSTPEQTVQIADPANASLGTFLLTISALR